MVLEARVNCRPTALKLGHTNLNGTGDHWPSSGSLALLFSSARAMTFFVSNDSAQNSEMCVFVFRERKGERERVHESQFLCW